VEGLAKEALRVLLDKKQTVAAAESMTGGALMKALITVPGASASVLGGIVCYHTTLKTGLLGVSPDIIRTHGVVSKETASAMAEAIREKTSADIGLSTSGNAGPDLQGGSVKEVWIALSKESGTVTDHLVFSTDTDRKDAIDEAVRSALQMIITHG
jgi:PncC family amidohydrolase